MSNVGMYEAEALRWRRDELLAKRRRMRRLSPYEGAELDRLIESVGDGDEQTGIQSAVEALARGEAK